jgi:hypothetical protein
MSAKNVKKFLIDKDLTFADMARGLATKDQSEDAIRVMLSQMAHGHRFYPTLAKRAKELYGVTFRRAA